MSTTPGPGMSRIDAERLQARVDALEVVIGVLLEERRGERARITAALDRLQETKSAETNPAAEEAVAELAGRLGLRADPPETA